MIRYIKILLIVLAAVFPAGMMAESPFSIYDDDMTLARKYISAQMLRTLGDTEISTGTIRVFARDLTMVDVVECIDADNAKKVYKEVKNMVKGFGQELLWRSSNRNGMETLLYGKVDRSGKYYTSLLVIESLRGYRIKACYIEGKIPVEMVGGLVYENDAVNEIMNGFTGDFAELLSGAVLNDLPESIHGLPESILDESLYNLPESFFIR